PGGFEHPVPRGAEARKLAPLGAAIRMEGQLLARGGEPADSLMLDGDRAVADLDAEPPRARSALDEADGEPGADVARRAERGEDREPRAGRSARGRAARVQIDRAALERESLLVDQAHPGRRVEAHDGAARELQRGIARIGHLAALEHRASRQSAARGDRPRWTLARRNLDAPLDRLDAGDVHGRRVPRGPYSLPLIADEPPGQGKPEA